ncbi:ATP-binding protein [Phormidium tenue FACHB-886]|nr:ATP-binding protein [Phormidium tenue FACHB-886]
MSHRSIKNLLDLSVAETIAPTITTPVNPLTLDYLPSSNCYDCWTPATTLTFVGRKSLFFRLHEAINKRHSVSLVGDWRIGKSSVLKTLLEQAQSQRQIIKFLSGEDAESDSMSAFVQAITQEKSPNTADGAANVLNQWAEVVGQSGSPPVILIDEVEGLINRFEHRFFERLRGMLGRLILVLASRQPLHTLYEKIGRTSPFYNRLNQQWLGLIEAEAAEELVQRGSHYLSEQDKSAMRLWAGRHPFYLQLLGWHLINAKFDQESIEQGLERFCVEAFPRLGELWRCLSDREQQALQDCLKGNSVNLRSLRLRGLVDEAGQPFGQVLLEWMREEL